MRKPRGREDMQAVGVFAQRTKYRPNPLGITAVQLLGIEGNIVKVRGLDALDGTPVLDIKPYMPPFDRMENVKMPEWVGLFMDGYF
jgi:tRNA-Thr(GGU) m(6)t(6)A37 methyltransferase TsaA